jgi:anti-sigma-K factor RskA
MSLTHHEIEELLGAYALDAVDPEEAQAIEAHLLECPRCRAEVAQHREVAAHLVGSPTGDVPAGVWDLIASELGEVPPPVPIEVALGARRRRNRPARVLTGLAAAAVVALLALLGGLVLDQRSEITDLEARMESAQLDAWVTEALGEPGTEVVALTGDQADVAARAIVRGDGEGLLLADDLPALGTGRTYQLWGLPAGGEDMISLGVLGPEPSEASFHAASPLEVLAVSAEPDGGSTAPTTDPVVTGAVT